MLSYVCTTPTVQAATVQHRLVTVALEMASPATSLELNGSEPVQASTKHSGTVPVRPEEEFAARTTRRPPG